MRTFKISSFSLVQRSIITTMVMISHNTLLYTQKFKTLKFKQLLISIVGTITFMSAQTSFFCIVMTPWWTALRTSLSIMRLLNALIIVKIARHVTLSVKESLVVAHSVTILYQNALQSIQQLIMHSLLAIKELTATLHFNRIHINFMLVAIKWVGYAR